MDKAREARRRLLSVEYLRGRGVGRENGQRVLDALWEASRMVGTPGMLPREVFHVLMYKPNGTPKSSWKYLRELFDLGCFGEKTKIEKRQGSPFVQIELVRDKIPEPENTAKPASQAPKEQKTAPFVVPRGWELVPKGSREKETVRRETQNTALIFVDVGNMTGKQEGLKENSRLLPLCRFNWREFARLIAAGYGNKEPMMIKNARAYIYAEVGDRITVQSNAQFSGFEPIFHHKRDTDALMAGDIGLLTRDAMETHERLTIVLVSGDGDYNHTLKQLKQIAHKKNVVLRIWVIARLQALSWELKSLADVVTNLEKVENYNLDVYAPNVVAHAR